MKQKWKNIILPKGITVENGYVKLRVTRLGRPIAESFGCASSENIQAAKRRLSGLDNEAYSGNIKGKEFPIPFPAAVEIFKDKYGKKMGRMYNYSTVALVNYFKPHYFHNLNYLIVSEYRPARKLQGIKDSAINKELSTLSRMYKMFDQWKTLEIDGIQHYQIPKRNPVDFVPRVNEAPFRRVRILDSWELSVIAKHSQPRLLRIIVAALTTVLRQADIFNLHPDKFISTLDKIRGIQGKTKKEFNLPATKSMLFLMGTATDKLIDKTNYRRLWEQMRVEFIKEYEKSGRPYVPFEFRDLRRTALRAVWDETKDIIACRDIAGHKNSKTTEQYLGIEAESLKDAGRALDAKTAPLLKALHGKSQFQIAQTLHKTHKIKDAKTAESITV